MLQLISLLVIGIASIFSAQSFAQLPFPRITQLEEENIKISLDGFVEEAAWQSLPEPPSARPFAPGGSFLGRRWCRLKFSSRL